MAGHSKWANIKHRKGAQDAKRSKIFAKISREIMVAAAKGSDVNFNPNLRLALAKARANSMPKKNIETAINKATGQNQLHSYKEIIYAGNIHGVSIIVIFLADNANRVASSVQAYFNRVGGTVSSLSSVNYIFELKGVLQWEKNAQDNDDEWMLIALEAGALDFEVADNHYFVYTKPQDFNHVKQIIESHRVDDFISAEIAYMPNQEVVLSHDKATKILNFIDKLEDDEDVQAVYHNLDSSSLEASSDC